MRWSATCPSARVISTPATERAEPRPVSSGVDSEHGRQAELFHQPAGDNADYAAVPIRLAEHKRRILKQPGSFSIWAIADS